jgi:hypothetical protein
MMLTLALTILASLSAEQAVTFKTNGAAIIQNSQVKVRASNRPGSAHGLTGWVFKPTGAEMIDVLYGQTDYVEGHVLGERWDPVDFKGYRKGRPNVGRLLVSMGFGEAKNGTAAMLVQESRGEYRMRKTYILRRDHAALELRYELQNLNAEPKGFSLRFHSAMSPGARGKYQRPDDMIFMDTESGICKLDQTLAQDKYHAKYGNDTFFLPAWADEPGRHWVRGKLGTPALKANWAAQVNATFGDGMAFVVDQQTLVGYYNCPGITLEPVMKAIALEEGEIWRTKVFLSSFTGAKGMQVEGANPLFIELKKVRLDDDRIVGELIPLFQGQMRLLDHTGHKMLEMEASNGKNIKIDLPAEPRWSIQAFDSVGHKLGIVASDGGFELSEPESDFPHPKKPKSRRSVYLAKNDTERIESFLAQREFTVYCDWSASEYEKDFAQKLSLRTGAGLSWTNPQGQMIVIGTPDNNEVVRHAGLLKHSISAGWPGKEKGAILYYENFEDTESPLLLIAGSDGNGVAKAIDFFSKKFTNSVKGPSGFAFWPAATNKKIYPYTRPPAELPEKISLEVSRGETESAQAVITAYEKLKGLEVKVAPLVDSSGTEMSKRHYTHYRRRRGPLLLRWVNYYPTKRDNGWSGYPDPLLEQGEKRLEAGRSQAIWLTAYIPEAVKGGLYTSSVTVSSGEWKKTIPIEVKVWDFVIPREGIMAEPYMALEYMAPNDRRELQSRHIRALVENFVDHGMRVFHIRQRECFRWHFSTDGQFKGKAMDWLVVSEDGKVALDTGHFDWMIDEIDKWAKPYPVRFMIYIQTLTHKYSEFKKALPKRFADKPKREGHWYQGYYAEEMIGMLKKHLDAKGLSGRVILKIADEPQGFDWWWDRFTLAARNVDMPFMTAFNSIHWPQVEKALGSGLKVIQPLYMKHDEDFFKRAQRDGHLVSWYNCGPPPTINIGSTASEIRGYLWQAAKYDLDIICWWGIQCWSYHATDLWTNRYSHHNSLVYMTHPDKPPLLVNKRGWIDTAPIDGIRWELIREGIEDSRYVTLLRQELARVRKKGKKKAADQAEKTLENIWKDVFPTLNDYEPEYNQIYECRRKLADAIIELKKIN